MAISSPLLPHTQLACCEASGPECRSLLEFEQGTDTAPQMPHDLMDIERHHSRAASGTRQVIALIAALALVTAAASAQQSAPSSPTDADCGAPVVLEDGWPTYRTWLYVSATALTARGSATGVV